MTTTTANAGKVMQHLEYFLDVVWPDLKVHLTSVTDEWAGAAIGGPKARDILAACVTGTAVDNDALPFMGIVHGEIAGAPVMICRLSFSGEMAFEVYCGAGHGTHVWKALIEAGKPFGMVALRAGGAGHAAHREGPRHRRRDRRPHHGARPASRLDAVEEEAVRRLDDHGPRRACSPATASALVGVISLDNRPLAGGAHIVEQLDEATRTDSIGHITSACYSPALGSTSALALVKGGKSRHGAAPSSPTRCASRFGPVEIVSHHFFDPEGSRMHG